MFGLTLVFSVFKNMSLDPICFHEGSKERSGRCDSKEIEVAIFLHLNIREGARYKVFLVTFIVRIGEGVLKIMRRKAKRLVSLGHVPYVAPMFSEMALDARGHSRHRHKTVWGLHCCYRHGKMGRVSNSAPDESDATLAIP